MLVSSPRTGEYLPAMKEGGVSAWRPIFDAFESRDDERIVAHCDPEIEWHTLWPGMERVFRGWAGVTRWRAAIDEALAGLSLQMEEAIQLGPDLFFLAYRGGARAALRRRWRSMTSGSCATGSFSVGAPSVTATARSRRQAS
jgi:hypothetical protein